MVNSLSDNIILFPDFEKLKNEIEKMRTELSMLLLEHDELKFVICKNIEAEYMLMLGGLEYKVYEAQCAVLRLKRKVELLQTKKNRLEKIIIKDIESALDDEFKEYEKKLEEQLHMMNDALKRSKAEHLSPEDTKEVKKLYRSIVKALHPDINPEISEEKKALFNNAVTAYENGDVETLRIIHEMVGRDFLPEPHQDAMTQLLKEKERLEAILKSVEERVEKIKSTYPYIMKGILESREKTQERKGELEKILEDYNEIIGIYKSKVEEMLR